MAITAPPPAAADIAREIGNDDVLKRRSKVVAFEDLPGVPEGTTGRVALVGGWDKWIRYHVLFDNGVGLGSVNREFLAPAKEYERLKARRAEVIESGVLDRPEVDEAEAAEDGDAAAGGGEGATVNGVIVPGHLLERAKNARQRLTGAA